jgi:hypothetical protein
MFDGFSKRYDSCFCTHPDIVSFVNLGQNKGRKKKGLGEFQPLFASEGVLQLRRVPGEGKFPHFLFTPSRMDTG